MSTRPGDRHMAGYELITSNDAPGLRLSLPTARRSGWLQLAMTGRRRARPITQTAKPVARSPTACLGTCLAGQGAGLVHVPSHDDYGIHADLPLTVLGNHFDRADRALAPAEDQVPALQQISGARDRLLVGDLLVVQVGAASCDGAEIGRAHV